MELEVFIENDKYEVEVANLKDIIRAIYNYLIQSVI
jgi:hypothetical protein